MTYSENRSAASAPRSKASHLVLALFGAAGLWAAAMAAQAGEAPAAQPAADAQTGAPAASKPAKPDPQDRVICQEEDVTGTRLGGRRICHTKREWDQIANDGGEALNNHVLGSGVQPGFPH